MVENRFSPHRPNVTTHDLRLAPHAVSISTGDVRFPPFPDSRGGSTKNNDRSGRTHAEDGGWKGG